ncbi:MAG: hypothetical protein ACLPZM_09040 [Thermoplasmata archaeon]
MPTSPTVREADLLARRVLRQRLNVRARENVTIECYPTALPWAAGFVRETRRLGARPLLHYEDETSYWTAIDEGAAAIVGTLGNPEMAALAATDVYVYFWGPEDMARRRTLSDATSEKAVAFNNRWYDVATQAGLRGARMGIARVTEANARLLGVPYRAWRKEMIGASTQDLTPLIKDATRINQRLRRGKTIRLHHSNGTDLTLALAGRTPVESLGRVTPANMKSRFGRMATVPEALVYTSVDEGVAEGTFVANRPSTSSGTRRAGGQWRFENGRLSRAQYREGGASFRTAYRSGGVDRSRPAFIEFGLDPSIHVSPMLEESERGTVSIGIGANASFGGKNKTFFSDYLALAGADVLIDDIPVLRRGRIV